MSTESVPRYGTYVSEDNNFKVDIAKADPNNGQIEYTYETTYSPDGGFKAEDQIGHYSWVSDNQGKSGTPPFSISFFATNRPEGRPYCIYDTWTGAYQVNDTLLMEGARSYVNNEGVVETMSLGTLTFSQE